MIGGNLKAIFQSKSVVQNEIGEGLETWTDSISIVGWLDLSSGNYTKSHKTKIEESTHILLTDYNSDVRELDCSQCRCLINRRIYEVTFIDDPMEINDHLEIFLKLVGVVNA